jgi:LDH2 family malate/lactate/ureidoglycolate dehydrogenase
MDVLRKYGFSENESDTIRDVLLSPVPGDEDSDALQDLLLLRRNIVSGRIIIGAKPEVITDTPVTAVINGHSAAGCLTARTAMESAIEKAENDGIGIVYVRNSNPFGPESFYTQMAERKNLVGYALNRFADSEQTDGSGPACHIFAAVNPSFFGKAGSEITGWLTGLRCLPDTEEVPADEDSMAGIKEMCDELGLDYEEYFGD